MTGELFDRQGRRLYLTADERKAFLAAAEKAERSTARCASPSPTPAAAFSEALALTSDRVDLEAGVIVFEASRSAARASTGPFRRRRRPQLPQPSRPFTLNDADCYFASWIRRTDGLANGRRRAA